MRLRLSSSSSSSSRPLMRSPTSGLDIVYHDYVYSRLAAPMQTGSDITWDSGGGSTGGERDGIQFDAGTALAAAAAFAMLQPVAASAAAAQPDGHCCGSKALSAESSLPDGQAMLAVDSSGASTAALQVIEAHADSTHPQGVGPLQVQSALRVSALPGKGAVSASVPMHSPPGLADGADDLDGTLESPSDAADITTAHKQVQQPSAAQRADNRETVPVEVPEDCRSTKVGMLWSVPEDAVAGSCPPQAQRSAAGSSSRRLHRRTASGAIQAAHAPGYTGRPSKKAEGKAKKAACRNRAASTSGKALRDDHKQVAVNAQEQPAWQSCEAAARDQAGMKRGVTEQAPAGAASHSEFETARRGGLAGEKAVMQAPAGLVRAGTATSSTLAAVSSTAGSSFPAAAVASGLAIRRAAPEALPVPALNPAAAGAAVETTPPAVQPPMPAAPTAAAAAGLQGQAMQAEAHRQEQLRRRKKEFLATARDCAAGLFDPGSLEEDAAVTPGVLTARGAVARRPAYMFCLAPDLASAEGNGGAASQRVCGLIDRAVMAGAPVVALHTDQGSPSSSIRGDVQALWAPVLLSQMDASGVVPQLSAQMSPGNCSHLVMQMVPDFSFAVAPLTACTGDPRSISAHAEAPDMSSSSGTGLMAAVQSFSTSALRQAGSLFGLTPGTKGFVASLGLGSRRDTSHTSNDSQSGHSCSCRDTTEALQKLRGLLALLPLSYSASAPLAAGTADCGGRSCPMLDAAAATLRAGRVVRAELLLRSIADHGAFLQLVHAPGSSATHHLAAGLCRLGGRTVGAIAATVQLFSSPAFPATTRRKVARLVRFCNAFNIPLITLLLPDLQTAATARLGSANSAGTLANLLFAYAEASVPKLTISASIGTCPLVLQCLRSDVTLAWAEPAALNQEEREQDDALPRPIRPRDSRRLLCAGLAPLLREARVVACPRRKHALPPL